MAALADEAIHHISSLLPDVDVQPIENDLQLTIGLMEAVARAGEAEDEQSPRDGGEPVEQYEPQRCVLGGRRVRSSDREQQPSDVNEQRATPCGSSGLHA